MQFIDILTPERIVCGVHAASKKRALEAISEHLGAFHDSMSSRQIMEALCSREKLGSTGLGHGVAIPHARIAGLNNPSAVLIRLDTPVNFDAPDHAPVDLLLALLVPECAAEEHLGLLAQIAELLSVPEHRQAMREAGDPQALYDLVDNWHLEPHGA